MSTKVEAQYGTQILPEFNFYKFDKTPVNKKAIPLGKLVLFIFFDVSCDHCRQAINIFNNHYLDLNKTIIYLITLDNKTNVEKFVQKYGTNLYGSKNVTVLQDLKNEFIVKFKPRKYPSMLLYSASGKLLLYDDQPASIGNFLQKINSNQK